MSLVGVYEGLTEASLQALAARFAASLSSDAMSSDPSLSWPLLIEMQGPLGAGKTTFVRFLLKALGHNGSVKSPTYSLLEPYPDILYGVFHWDLYRLGHPEELEYLGFRDLMVDRHCCIVEWADKGAGYLLPAQLVIQLEPDSETTRRLSISSDAGPDAS